MQADQRTKRQKYSQRKSLRNSLRRIFQCQQFL